MNLILAAVLVTTAPPSEGLIWAGWMYPGARVFQSTQHPTLMKMAQGHAEYQARVQQGGHQNWTTYRFYEIQRLGLGIGYEICAESWPEQSRASNYALGVEMFHSWSQSPGHWKTASTKHRYYGAGMAKGRNGIWYSCVIATDPLEEISHVSESSSQSFGWYGQRRPAVPRPGSWLRNRRGR